MEQQQPYHGQEESSPGAELADTPEAHRIREGIAEALRDGGL